MLLVSQSFCWERKFWTDVILERLVKVIVVLYRSLASSLMEGSEYVRTWTFWLWTAFLTHTVCGSPPCLIFECIDLLLDTTRSPPCIRRTGRTKVEPYGKHHGWFFLPSCHIQHGRVQRSGLWRILLPSLWNCRPCRFDPVPCPSSCWRVNSLYLDTADTTIIL